MLLAEKLNNLGSQLYKEGKRQAARSMIARALSLWPDNVGIQVNHACVLTNFGEYDKAAKLFHAITQKYPNHLLAWHGYGVLNMVAAHPEHAITCFEQCMRIAPDDGAHKFDLACACIQASYWDRGLELYEGRRTWKPERHFDDMKSWSGEKGKRIYVWAEQGIGDSFQYARYLPWLRSISESVTFAVPPYLLEIFRDVYPDIKVVSLAGALVDSEYHVPLMSLCYFHGIENVPKATPFKADNFKSYQSNGKKKIALCWACNGSSANYLERSLPFEALLKLTELDYEFHSVQVGKAASDVSREAAQNLVTDHSAELNEDWCATRDLLASCDFVVSTDTSVAHLAASMNIPTIMFLARRDWWRWGNYSSKTIWYPSMTIIRQEIPFKWEKEINQAYALLQQAASESIKDIAA